MLLRQQLEELQDLALGERRTSDPSWLPLMNKLNPGTIEGRDLRLYAGWWASSGGIYRRAVTQINFMLPADVEGTSIVEQRGYGRPLYQEVEEATSRRYVSATDSLSARLPTRDEAAQLFIRPDTPVLHLVHIGFDADHRPIEVAQATWPGPQTTLTETYPVPGPLDDTDPDVSIG